MWLERYDQSGLMNAHPPFMGKSHHNAAVNLKNLVASSAVSACGEEGSGARRKVRVKPSSMKQEVSFDDVCA